MASYLCGCEDYEENGLDETKMFRKNSKSSSSWILFQSLDDSGNLLRTCDEGKNIKP